MVAPVSAAPGAVWRPPEASPIFALLHTTKDQGAWACATVNAPGQTVFLFATLSRSLWLLLIAIVVALLLLLLISRGHSAFLWCSLSV